MLTRRRGASLLLLFVACACRPQALPTPRPGVTPLPLVTLTPAPFAEFYPASRPSAVRGKPLFQSNCTICHGEAGRGDGPQAPLLNPHPTDFTRPESSRQASPQRWYRSISEGVIGTAMPSWKAQFSEAQRWDLVFYVWSLGTTPQRLRTGGELYNRLCSDCHGAQGQGSGPRASEFSRPPADFTNARRMAARTGVDLYQAIAAGVPTLPSHAWTELSDEERWEIVEYLWTFMYER